MASHGAGSQHKACNGAGFGVGGASMYLNITVGWCGD